MTLTSVLPLVVISALLMACGAGSGDGLDDNGEPLGGSPGVSPEPTTEPSPEPGPSAPTLARLVTDIFDNPELGDQRCTNCHAGASPLGGLNLDSELLAYAALVGDSGEGVTANGNSSFKRVQPGSPDESYIVLKLEGDSRAGNPMPLGQAPLNAALIQQVRDWITNGAPFSGGGSSPAKITASHKSEPGVAVYEISLHSSRPLEQPLSTRAVQVYWHNGGESTLANPEDWLLFVQPGGALVYLFPPAGLEAGELVINDSDYSTVLDQLGNELDGDGDLQPGGAFRYDVRF